MLNDTITKDLKEATKLTNAKALELRQERLNLISVKIKEELHQDVTLEAREGITLGSDRTNSKPLKMICEINICILYEYEVLQNTFHVL